MKGMESARRFIRISKADTPLRRLWDRVSGWTMTVVLICAVFFGIGWSINRIVERGTVILTHIIDWCGYHPFVPSITIALMIAGCVWLDYRYGK